MTTLYSENEYKIDFHNFKRRIQSNTNEFNTVSSTKLFTTADISLWPERYNLFVLDEPVDIILNQGQFTYQIYQSSTPYVLPLTIAQSTGVVIEEGRMVVSGPIGTSIYD